MRQTNKNKKNKTKIFPMPFQNFNALWCYFKYRKCACKMQCCSKWLRSFPFGWKSHTKYYNYILCLFYGKSFSNLGARWRQTQKLVVLALLFTIQDTYVVSGAIVYQKLNKRSYVLRSPTKEASTVSSFVDVPPFWNIRIFMIHVVGVIFYY